MEKYLEVDDLTTVTAVFGTLNHNIQSLEAKFKVSIEPQANGIRISGLEQAGVDGAAEVLTKLFRLQKAGHEVTHQTAQYLAEQWHQGAVHTVTGYSPDTVCVTAKGRPIKGKTEGQNRYIKEMKRKDIVFATGPAGTGKTFLAVAMAVDAFRKHEVSRIILTRPAVEAGEKLGFLPGDLQMKVDLEDQSPSPQLCSLFS